MKVLCDHCGKPAKLVGGASVYPHRPDLSHKMFYLRPTDKAWVGCHPGGVKPLGRLADAKLRAAKQAVHAVFDPIWQERLRIKSADDPRYTKAMARGGRYKALAAAMGIPIGECHVGMFSVERCNQAISIINSGGINE